MESSPLFSSAYRWQMVQMILRGLGGVVPHRSKPAVDSAGTDLVYLAHNGIPFDSGGYATRTQGILSGIKNLQRLQPQCFLRWGYPTDLKDHLAPESPYVHCGVEYHLSPFPKQDIFQAKPAYERLLPLHYFLHFVGALSVGTQNMRPYVVHAASSFLNGVAGLCLAQERGVPFVYEVRGLWELTSLSRNSNFKRQLSYHWFKRMETAVAQRAELVLTLTTGLKKILVERGVPEEKIVLLPNGVDAEKFRPRPKDPKLVEQYQIQNSLVLGYAGSLVDYEGLDFLLEVLATLKDQPWKFLILGRGKEETKLRALVEALELQDKVLFLEAVSFEEMPEYLNLFDVCPLPRRSLPVTENVSPIKPLEAMAMEKVVLASSVGALAEMIQDGKTGWVFEKGNADSLRQKLLALLQTPPQNLARIGQQARDWVLQERDWKVLSTKLESYYQQAWQNLTQRSFPE